MDYIYLGEDVKKLFVLNSPGGYGKTFTFKLITAKIRSEGGIVLCVASTGRVNILIWFITIKKQIILRSCSSKFRRWQNSTLQVQDSNPCDGGLYLQHSSSGCLGKAD
jgi:hypothetical protein